MFQFKTILFFVATVGLICPGFASKDTCPYAYSPDGSTYDLTDIEGSYYYSVNFNGVNYNLNISICTAFGDAPCGCCQYYSGACLYWGSSANPKTRCLGNSWTREVIGLNGGAGVQIKYTKGDVCETCEPDDPRETVITLLCDNAITDKSKIYWNNVVLANPGQPPVYYFNGTFHCTAPSMSEVEAKEKPKSVVTSAKLPNQGPTHVQIQYTGHQNGTGQVCNIDLPSIYLITTIWVYECTPGCQLVGDDFTITECDQPVSFPTNTSWIQTQMYTDNLCSTYYSSVYTKQSECDTFTGFSYQTCDREGTTVYTYSCNGPNCGDCQLVDKARAYACIEGREYTCIGNGTAPYNRD